MRRRSGANTEPVVVVEEEEAETSVIVECMIHKYDSIHESKCALCQYVNQSVLLILFPGLFLESLDVPPVFCSEMGT
jgi:hypothetical protein